MVSSRGLRIKILLVGFVHYIAHLQKHVALWLSDDDLAECNRLDKIAFMKASYHLDVASKFRDPAVHQFVVGMQVNQFPREESTPIYID